MYGRVEDEVAEAVELLRLVMEISDALVDLGVFLIGDTPRLPKSAREVLAAVTLILERLQMEHASGAGPWV
jgi:hypothetical protein